MALGAAPGSENPSAAYLAGQQHGTKLAIRHAVPAKTPVKKQASPKPKPKGKQQTTVPPRPMTPLEQAQALAAADTKAQVDAITSQQALYNKQAQDRATQVTLASQAAAKFLAGIGDQTAGSYNNAAQIIAGFAGGYSGDLKNTATDAAAAQAAQLAQLGAPAGGLKTSTGETTQPASLANVLYGLGGAIPANALVTSGQALAGAQRQLPQATLGYGQQQAAGTLASGQEQAASLIPQLIAAQGKQPGLVQDYLSKIQSALMEQKKYDASRSDEAFNRKLETWRAALDAKKYKTSIDEFNITSGQSQARINQTAATQARLAFQSDRTYAISLANLGLATKKAQLAALAADYKLQNGGFTKPQMNRFQTDAKFVIGQAKTSKAFVDGKVTYDSVMQEMLARHVPLTLADQQIRAWNPVLPGTPIDAPTLKGYNQMTGVGSKASPFEVVNFAKDYLGIPYSWGGGTPKGPTKGFAQGANITGYDCSSFVQAVMARVGVQLPRTTYAQVKAGRPVTLAELQPGDLIFTRPGKNGPNHVGLYIGNGQVQASPHTGDVNKIQSLAGYLTGGFVAARRVLG